MNGKYSRGTLLNVDTEQVTNALGDVPVFGAAYPSVFVIDQREKIGWRFVSEADELRLTGATVLERAVGPVIDQKRRRELEEGGGVTATSSNSAIGLGNHLSLGIE